MSTFQFKSQENLSLRQRIMSDIRNAITRGHLRPGDKLRESEISRQMAVSRGPVREALRDLEAGGLVVSSPYKETAVADVQREEVVDLLIPVRLQLELYVLKHDAPKMNASWLQLLKTAVDDMESSAAGDDLFALVEADIRFHEHLLSLDDSTYIKQIWAGIANRLRLHFIKNTRHFPDLRRVPRDHLALLHALEQREPHERIAELWTRHIRDEDCLLCFHDAE